MLPLQSTGIDGLDEMLGGGFPAGSIVAVLGSFGTGKTTMSLQYVLKGLSSGEKCIYISLEEDERSILKNAMTYGWDLQRYIDSSSLSIIKLEPSDARSAIERVRSEFPSFIKNFGAGRIVIDSVSLLTMLYEDANERRAVLFNLCKLIRQTGAGAMLTSEVNENHPSSSRDGMVEYTVDGVIYLQSIESRDGSEQQLTLRIVKMRGIGHSRRIRPYSISREGIIVHSGSEVF
ncbi:MAG: KaiC domain-containing protein [Thermoplasmata archaeon]|uniref:KaiC domain-containing protein n=1 Tax=Candidatus Sysuiplasma superficiale TaxID=2823368 RepID=A0A8J7YIG2_9ARCH|nr:KaiC domain-containing protein [Candidatus Sysuiplasma superficiale]MBX8644912.1 KaiC domain-containing protein [Candidatus Sysuiplasma superficiale]